jgi:hypothetical protein
MECEKCGRIGHVKAFCWDMNGNSNEFDLENGHALYNGLNNKQVNIQGLFIVAPEKGLHPLLMSHDEFELWKQVKNAANGTKAK